MRPAIHLSLVLAVVLGGCTVRLTAQPYTASFTNHYITVMASCPGQSMQPKYYQVTDLVPNLSEQVTCPQGTATISGLTVGGLPKVQPPPAKSSSSTPRASAA